MTTTTAHVACPFSSLKNRGVLAAVLRLVESGSDVLVTDVAEGDEAQLTAALALDNWGVLSPSGTTQRCSATPRGTAT